MDTGLPYPEERPEAVSTPEMDQEVNVSPSFQGQYDGTLIKWQLEFNDILESIERNLKGEVFDISRGGWIKRPEARMINDKGVAAVMQIVGVFLNKGTVLSNLREKETNEMTLAIVDAVIDLLELKYQEYQVDKAHLQMIIDLIEGYVFCALNRAKDGTTLKFLKSTEKHIESHTTNTGGQKNPIWSFFDKFSPGGGR